MFGMSFVELGIVAVIALLLLGPDQLPGVARTIGKGLRDLRRASDDLKQTFEQEMVKLEADVNKLPPKPRVPATEVTVETTPLTSSSAPLLAGASLTLDQARQSTARVDPGLLRAQARALAAPQDPGAARAAARLAAIAPAPALPSATSEAGFASPTDSALETAADHVETSELLAEAKVSAIEAKIETAAAQAELNAMARELPPPETNSNLTEPGLSVLTQASPSVNANLTEPGLAPVAAALPPEELQPLRPNFSAPAIVAPTEAPPATVARGKPDPK